MMWNPREKPPADVCPQRYCWHWLEQGTWYAPGLYDSLREATRHLVPVTGSRCGCRFGRCTRLDPTHGDNDWYESDGAALARDGLPWFYFYPDEAKLRPEWRAKYRKESGKLWGGRPGETDA